MIQVRTWGKAVTRMPRLSAEEFGSLDVFGRWLVITRAAALIMTLISCLIGGGFALRDGKLSWPLWLWTTVGLLFAHATNNLINDLTDTWKGTDKDNYFRTQYGVQPLEQGLMSRKVFYTYLGVTGAIALACGAYLVTVRSQPVLYLFLAGIFFVLFYTWPLKYFGFGELAVVAVWGPLMSGGTYFVVTGEWSWLVAAVGTVYALGPTQVIFGKHIDKLQADTLKKVRTLPVILGDAKARRSVMALMVIQYVLAAGLIVTGQLPLIFLLIFLSAGTFVKAFRVYRAPRPAECPPTWMADVWPLWFAAWSFWHGARVGLFLLIGLGLDLLFPALRGG